MREGEFLSANAVQSDVQLGTSERRVVDVAELAGIDAQLRGPENGIDAHIHKRRYRDRPHNRDAVLHVAKDAQVAAGLHNRLNGQRNGVGASTRVGRILQHYGSVGI